MRPARDFREGRRGAGTMGDVGYGSCHALCFVLVNFMAFLADKDIRGAINGSSKGTISIREIIEYVEKRTGAKAVIDKAGENAPYNGEPEYSINTEKAEALGVRFSVLQDWIYGLLDHYISLVD